MAELGVGAYRFSVAWPRVQPEGSGAANPAAWTSTTGWWTACWSAASSRSVTLFHWDLPQALEDGAAG